MLAESAIPAPASEGATLIQYDAQPNYANWGGVTNFFFTTYGVRVPPDMKGSGPTLAALLREQNNTVADVAYYNALVALEAGERGVHQPYKPQGWEKIPDTCKDPNGLWFCVHQGVIAFVVNTEALKSNAMRPSQYFQRLWFTIRLCVMR